MKYLLLAAAVIVPLTSFAQYQHYESGKTDTLLYLKYIVIFAVAVVITRLVFSVPLFLRHVKVQTRLMKAMAEKAGVETDKIERIMVGLKNPLKDLMDPKHADAPNQQK